MCNVALGARRRAAVSLLRLVAGNLFATILVALARGRTRSRAPSARHDAREARAVKKSGLLRGRKEENEVAHQAPDPTRVKGELQQKLFARYFPALTYDPVRENKKVNALYFLT